MPEHEPLGPDALVAKKQRYLLPCSYHFYKAPPQIVRGRGIYVYDSQGRRYMDLYSGVSVHALGHCHPEMVEAICAQVRTLQHTSTIYLTEPIVNLAEDLAEVLPGQLRRTFFCCSGSEANEGAALLATLYTGRGEFVAMLAVIGVWHRSIPGQRTVLTTMVQRGTNAICPAPLAAVHASNAADGGNCIECHSFFVTPSSIKCLECHDEIEARLAAQSGYHGKLTGPCRQCHRIPEHTEELAGAKFTGLGHECQSCHADPHEGQMSFASNTCHRETGWTGNDLLFSHDRHASFKLDGLHSVLECSACHGRQQKHYRPLPHECGACHRTQQSAMQGISRTFRVPPDPHYGRLACADCHDTNDLRQSTNSYARRCADCHNDEYGQLAHEWARTLQQRQSTVEQLMESRDEVSLEQIREDLSEAMECGFHNLDLTRRLYDHIVEALRDGENGTTMSREEGMR